jgi:hypothetical protein
LGRNWLGLPSENLAGRCLVHVGSLSAAGEECGEFVVEGTLLEKLQDLLVLALH